MVVATINWALLLITESISLLDLCKYANAMLIHTSNYVPLNMWQSGTLSLWLTGKSVGSVKNLSNDSELKWLCRETIMNEDCAARLRLLSSASSGVCVFLLKRGESMQPLLSVCIFEPRLLKTRKSNLFSAAASVLLFSAHCLRVCILSWLGSTFAGQWWDFCAHIRCQIITSSNESAASWKHLLHLNCNYREQLHV